MVELKILKDIGKDTRFCSKLPMFARSELREMLKEEAINWIKQIEHSTTLTFQENIGPFIKEDLDKKSIIVWIKHFFNINDEDL